MSKFTGTFSWSGSVSASGTVTLNLNVDAADGANHGSIWGTVSGGGTISYKLSAPGKPGYPHSGSADFSSMANSENASPDITTGWLTINQSSGPDAIRFDGNWPALSNYVPTYSNGLSLDGLSITGALTIIPGGGFATIPTAITLKTTAALPTLYNLAEMSQDVEGSAPSIIKDDTGHSAWTPAVASFQQTDPTGEFQAYTYENADQSQVVVAFRGTVWDGNDLSTTLKTLTTDIASFPTGIPTVGLIKSMLEAVALLNDVVKHYPNAHITLTGHSLGGSIAQMLGKATAYSTVAFDAPGAADIYNSASMQSVLNGLAVRPDPGANANVRVQGDWVSMQGKQFSTPLTIDAITLAHPDAAGFLLANHQMSAVLTELKESGTYIFPGILEDDAFILAGTQFIRATKVSGAFAETIFLISYTANAIANLIDPPSGKQFVYVESNDSPAMTSISFVDDPSIASFKIWSQAGGQWSAAQTVKAGSLVTLAAGTHAIKFEGLSSSGQIIALPDGYMFNSTLASTGHVSAELHSINFDSFDGINVQKPAAGQSVLNIASNFKYADAGDGSLTVNGTPSGNDTILLGSGNKTVNLFSGNDFVMVKDGATGTILIHGGSGAETILANAANVTLVAGTGDILFTGGDDSNAHIGVNTIDYSALGSAVNVNLATGFVQTTNNAITTLVNVENVTGSQSADHLTGDAKINILNGGAGADVLTGGAGNDKFVFDTAALTDAKAASPLFDEITDYTTGDQFDLSTLLTVAYNHGSGQAVASLVRAVEDPAGTFATLQIDPDGAANGANWINIARLDGLKIGNALNAILDSTLSAGSAFNVIALPASVSIGDATISEGNSGTKVESFTVTRTGGAAAFDVNFATSDGSATVADGDYVATSGTLHFNTGVNALSIAVTVNGDLKVEPDQNFTVNLSGATNGAAIADGQGVGTIVNDDASGSVSIGDATIISEGNGGTRVETFTVTRTGGTAAFNVNFATSDGSATVADGDYAANAGTLQFAPNVNTQTVSVTINGDTKFESDETLFVNLSGATNGATIADGLGMGTIANDDSAVIAGSVLIGDATISEGNSGTRVETFTVTRTGGTAAFDINFATSDGSATVADGDYVATSGTLHFNAGVNTQTIAVIINGDLKVEPDQNFSVNLSGAANGVTIADGLGMGIIANDDHAAQIDFNGDSKSDILWQNDNGTVAIWDSGQIGGAHWISNPGVVASSWHIAGKADFDGNGDKDILWQNDNGAVSIWDNGQIGGAHLIANPGVVANSWRIAGTGDFDGNGHEDILWQNSNGAVSIWDNGQIGGAHLITNPGAVPASSHIAGVGDFDGNGKSDVLWRDDNGAVFVWDNGQSGTAHTAAAAGVIPSGWHIAGTGDFDGNGKSDMLWQNDNGTVSIWDNGQIAAAHWITNPGAVAGSWHVAEIADFDGNGKSDILWHNDNGAAMIWDNGQPGAAHTIAAAGVVPAGWHIA
jgi:Calx-beta domain/Lipase (class 3)/RTX calcium-binding nonapeptide repeat (4 copies)/FG-GAP-like repeat